MFGWMLELLTLVGVLLFVCVAYLATVIAIYTIRYWKQKGAYADIPRLGTSSMPMFALFQPSTFCLQIISLY